MRHADLVDQLRSRRPDDIHNGGLPLKPPSGHVDGRPPQHARMRCSASSRFATTVGHFLGPDATARFCISAWTRFWGARQGQT